MKLRWLATPALAWLVFFILMPSLMVLALSFADRGTYGGVEWVWNFDNYARLFSAAYGWILWDTLKMAFATALICTALGVLCAWAMVTARPSRRALLFALVALPFLTNLVIRVYALKSFVGAGGPVQGLLTFLSWPFDPFVMTANPWLVFYGLITTYLPFAILPLHGALEAFDFAQVEAAQDLGAGPGRVLFSILLPQLKPALAGAFVLVFVPCMGEYVLPDLLGGAKTMLWGNLLTEQFLRARDWPFGAVLAVAMMLALLAVAGLRTLMKRPE